MCSGQKYHPLVVEWTGRLNIQGLLNYSCIVQYRYCRVLFNCCAGSQANIYLGLVCIGNLELAVCSPLSSFTLGGQSNAGTVQYNIQNSTIYNITRYSAVEGTPSNGTLVFAIQSGPLL